MLTAVDLSLLGANRWAMPLIAIMDASGGTRFAIAANALGTPRNSLSRAFQHLIDSGWVLRNTGHGHPLRPEYLLTEVGRPIAAASARMMERRRRLGLSPADLSRWTLPLIASIGGDQRRFNDLLGRLAPITPRALSLTIKQGLGVELIDRRLEASFPPLPLYGLTRSGLILSEALAR